MVCACATDERRQTTKDINTDYRECEDDVGPMYLEDEITLIMTRNGLWDRG